MTRSSDGGPGNRRVPGSTPRGPEIFAVTQGRGGVARIRRVIGRLVVLAGGGRGIPARVGLGRKGE